MIFRWRSADGNDYLCGFCQSPNEASKALSIPGVFNPRSFGKSADMEPMWRSGLKTNKGKKKKSLNEQRFLPHGCTLTLVFDSLGT